MNEVANDHITHDLRKANMRPYMTGKSTSGARPKNSTISLSLRLQRWVTEFPIIPPKT